MNDVSLIGNLVRETKLTTTSDGKKVLKNCLAVRRGKDITDFINVVAFGKTAELIAEHTRKGQQMGVTGSIWTGSYTKDDGTKVYTTEVCVNRLHFIGGGKNDNKANVENENEEIQEEFPF